MKKTVFIMFVAFLGVAYANAQTYVGGSLGFSSTTNDPKSGSKTTVSAYSFDPEIGYNLDPKLDIGLELLLGAKKDGDTKSSAFGASPYLRYSLLEFGQFSVLGKASLFVVGGSTKANANAIENKTTSFGLNVAPILAFNLTEHISLLANLNFLSLNFIQTNRKVGSTDLGKSTGFGLGIDANNVVNIGSQGVTIGFAYKF
jgi:hypothetical protein